MFCIRPRDPSKAPSSTLLPRLNACAWTGDTTSGAGSGASSGDDEIAAKYKTVLCRTWTHTGACGYGSKCRFAHGAEELRPKTLRPKASSAAALTASAAAATFFNEEDAFAELNARAYAAHALLEELWRRLKAFDARSKTAEDMVAEIRELVWSGLKPI